MSPQIQDLVIKIRADTTAFDKSLRRVQWTIWWMRFGPWAVIAVTFLLGIVVGVVAGVFGS